MRAAAIAVVIAAAACSGAPAHPAAPAHARVGDGVHGMVVFGGAHVYASHLPLWRHPHAAQVVLELEPDDPALAAALRAELATGALITFEPDPFDLGRLAPGAVAPPRSLTGTLYRGHFERGGAAWRAGVALRLERVLLFRLLDGAAAAPGVFAVGGGGQTFLIRRIGARPSCDRIDLVRGRVGDTTAGDDPPARALDDPAPVAVRDGELCPAPSPALLAAHGWQWQGKVYEEAGDLQ